MDAILTNPLDPSLTLETAKATFKRNIETGLMTDVRKLALMIESYNLSEDYRLALMRELMNIWAFLDKSLGEKGDNNE